MVNKELAEKYPFLRVEVDNSFVENETSRLAALKRKADMLTSVKTNHWASDGLGCKRELWFLWKSKETMPLVQGAGDKIMELGSAIEDNVVNNYRAVLVSTQKSITIPNTETGLKYHITGKIDLLIAERGELIVPVEVKSTKDFAEDFEYDKWKIYLPREEHVAQLTLYLHATKSEYGYLHYYNKNRSIEERFKVYYSDELYKYLVLFYAEVEQHLEKDAPPPIDPSYSRDKFPCAWYSRAKDKKLPVGMCPYYFHCWGNQIPQKGEKKKKESTGNVILPIM